ncbi:MAG: hypothetical protein AABW50_01695 [Nanoarchaeota archaeon]
MEDIIEFETDEEAEEIEFSLSRDEIDEWINELTLLKEEKIPIILMIDDETFLKINYGEENDRRKT